jgi:type II secretory pathway pseudopilin PulG
MGKKAQVWVETVIYTLIGLTIITIVLTIATPQIAKIKDRGIIDQTIAAMQILDDAISEVEQTGGNIKHVEFRIAKGSLEINPVENYILYVMEDTKLEVSEIGVEIPHGKINMTTTQVGGSFDISLKRVYSNLDITFNGGVDAGTLHAGATPYTIVIENLGADSFDVPVRIDFKAM